MKESRRKKIRWLFGLLFAADLFLHTISSPLITAFAADNTTRLSIEQTDFFINQTRTINITLKERISEESLSVSVDHTDILSAKFGRWSKDSVRLILKPKKDGTAVVTITSRDTKEKLSVTIHVQMRKIMSAEEIYEYARGAMVTLTSYDAVSTPIVGSGCFISANEVLTNYHVIEYANKLEITDCLGNSYEPVQIVSYDPLVDLAIIRVNQNASMALQINHNTVLTGETVYAMGSPLGFSGTISEGIVSKADRLYEGRYYHQNTAYISKSSGGGPLLNEYGEIIGIQTLVLTAGQTINFALTPSYLDFLDRDSSMSMEDFYELNHDKIKPNEIIIPLN